MAYRTSYRFKETSWRELIGRSGFTTQSPLWHENTGRFWVCGPAPEEVQQYFADPLPSRNGVITLESATYIGEQIQNLHEDIDLFFSQVTGFAYFHCFPSGNTYQFRDSTNSEEAAIDLKILHSAAAAEGRFDWLGNGASFGPEVPFVTFFPVAGRDVKARIYFAAVPKAMPFFSKLSQTHKRYKVWATHRRPKTPGFYTKSLRN